MTWAGPIAIIGAGQLGSALLEGLLWAGYDPRLLRVSTRSPGHATELAARHGVTALPLADAVRGAALVVAAARPGQMPEVVAQIAAHMAPAAGFVSMAGAPDHATLAGLLPCGIPVVRAMPNPAMAAGAGLTGFNPAPGCPEQTASRVRELFGELGTVIDVPEDRLGTIGSLAGHGQAVCYYVADALEQWGVLQGLGRAETRQIVAAALAGATRMLTAGARSPAELQHRLCTPGGTTIRTVSELDASGVRGAVIASIDGGRFAQD